MLFGLLRRSRHERAGFELYGAAVRAGRDPFFFGPLGVPDTLDGRFDVIGVHVFLLIRRLQRAGTDGPALAQAVFDAMFADMDVNLREMGVGDMSVGKRVRAMWEALHGRAQAYEAALGEGGPALAQALARNVWRGVAPEGDARGGTAADTLARLCLAQVRHLAAQADAALRAGRATFLPAAEAAA